ncbi:hypothetical protein XANCAGTX0491_000255 [Xanthoria calcicola]
MAANRDERFLMRQRGAGTRDINLIFDLQLPGVPTISRSPLRPQKSARSQSENSNPKVTRQTPKPKKAIPKLVSKRTPATTNNATPRTAVRGSNVERPDTSKQDPVPEPPQHVLHGVSAQKRKIDLYLTEGTTEGPELPPTKRRKKRKSIGQYPIRRKSTGAPPPKNPVQESKKRDKTKKVEEVPPEPTELVSEKIPQASEIPSENKTMQDPIKAFEVAQVANGPKRQKRKSNGQVQKPKRTPRLEGQAMVHARADDVEQQHIPAVADASLEERPQTSEIPKPQRRKRKTLMETSTRHKTTMQRMPSPQSVIRISDAVRSEPIPDQSIGTIVAAEQPKKRGRKPNATVKYTTNNPKEVTSLPVAVLEIPTPEGEPPLLGEIEPKADEASTVLKKTRKKRKPIGQTKKVKKKPAIRPLRAIDSKPTLVSDETAKNRRTAAAKSPPISQDRSHPESPQELSPKVDQAQVIPDHKSSVPAPAPNKRGRPKKDQAAPLTPPAKTASAERKPEHEVFMPAVAAKKRGRPSQADAEPQEQPTAIEPGQRELANEKLPLALTAQLRGRPKKAQTPQAAEIAKIERKHDEAEPAKAPPKRRGPKQRMPSANPTMPLEACQPVNRDAVPAETRRRAAKNASKLAVQENGCEALPEVPDAPTAEPEHILLSPAPVKKRGRPKKQAATPLVAEAAARKNPASQLRTSRYQSSVALAKRAPANVSRSRAKHSTALPMQEDVDEDPLSECTPLQLKHEAKVNPVQSRFHLVPRGTSLPSHKSEITINDHSDLQEEAPALKLTKRPAKALGKEPARLREPEKEVAAPHPPGRPSLQQGTPSLESQDSSPRLQPHHQHNRRTADLESHIEQSLLEENALKADLRELQAQRALEIVEQEERDRDVRLERLSAGVTTKKQKQQQADEDPQHQVRQEEPVLGVKKKKKNARELENLFRTVSGTRKGSGGGDIDPDLQGILDQVKGVARGRSGEIMKIF